MADKKTSQETSGAPIEGSDLWRIARSGSNYKLTSGELFSETLTVAQFQAKATANQLIAGRNYLVTGCGQSGIYDVIFTATDVANQSLHGIVYDPGNYAINGAWIMFEFGLSTNYAILDPRGNFWMQTPVTPMSGYNNQFIQHQDQGSGGKYYDNSVFKNSTVYSLGDMNIQNSVLDNVIIISDTATNYIQNCRLSNCTITLNEGITLNNLNIIGDDPVRQYDFFEGVSNGTIISREYSTLTKSLNLSNAGTYNGVNTINLTPYNAWVGTYLLQNPPSDPINIEFITGCENTHTPILFQHDSSTNEVMNITHQTTISATGTNEICFASHHGSNDHLDSPGSFTKMRWDGTIWRGEEVVNYNA